MVDRYQIPVSPYLRIPQQAVDDEMLVERGIEKVGQFEMDRIEWVRKRELYYLGWDDYSSSARKGLWESSSNLRLPLTEIQCTALHALIMQAVFFYRPWFYVDPQENIDVERVQKIELAMKYILERQVNYHKGIYLSVDDWAWDLVTEGVGIFNRGWDTLQRKFKTVEENPEFLEQAKSLNRLLEDTEAKEFSEIANASIKPYVEKDMIRTVFNGPTVFPEDPMYILFKGSVIDATDLNEHETVAKVCYFTRSQLVKFKDSEYFDADVVEEVLDAPPDSVANTAINTRHTRIRQAKDYQTGINTGNTADSWEFYCIYDTVSLDKKNKYGMPDRIQYFVRPNQNLLARWTYLDRITANGKIPLHMAHLFRRPRRSIGRGMVQTMYNMNDCIDVLINQSIDAGTLANNPMFGFRANSTFDPQDVKVFPGLGIPMDNPKTDLNFYHWAINPNWSQPVIGLVSSMAQQLTAIGPNTVGQVGEKVGPLRSTSGVQALGAKANTVHDVVIKRAKICISEMFEGLYMDYVDRMNDRMKFTVTGAGGIPMTGEEGQLVRADLSKEELRTRVHFGLYANSDAMNKQGDKQDAMAIAQLLLSKINLETGVVTPNEVYEINANALRPFNAMRPEKFIRRPGPSSALPMAIELQMIMQGLPPPISIQDPERAAKLERYNGLLNSDRAQLEASQGIVAKGAMEILKSVIEKHQRFEEATKQPTNLQNPMGDNQSPTAKQGLEASQGKGEVNE